MAHQEPGPSPDTSLTGVLLWESMGRQTILRSNRLGGHWPQSSSYSQMIRETAIFAENFIAADCIPIVTVHSAGVTVMGNRRNPLFSPYVSSDCAAEMQVVVYVKFEPNCGEIWLTLRPGNEPQHRVFTIPL